MDRKKFTAGLAAFLAGAALLVGNAQAELTGYVVGDPAPGKLVPAYDVGHNTATLIGIENTFGRTPQLLRQGRDISVHVGVFTVDSVDQVDLRLCLSPYDFGFIVLQGSRISPSQLDELLGDLHRITKAAVITSAGDHIADQGYVAMRAVSWFDSQDGTCAGTPAGVFADTDPEPLAAWAILQDVGLGFFAAEIPTVTARVNPQTLKVSGGFGAYGLIPAGNTVNVRFDVNPLVDSQTSVYAWFTVSRARNVNAFLECEDEQEISTGFSVPHEVNVFDPDLLAGIGLCKITRQYRGVLLFDMPDTGFVWSQISQQGQHFRENFIGYNLDCNTFVDPTCTIGNPPNVP